MTIRLTHSLCLLWIEHTFMHAYFVYNIRWWCARGMHLNGCHLHLHSIFINFDYVHYLGIADIMYRMHLNKDRLNGFGEHDELVYLKYLIFINRETFVSVFNWLTIVCCLPAARANDINTWIEFNIFCPFSTERLLLLNCDASHVPC